MLMHRLVLKTPCSHETHEALAGIQKWVGTGALPNGIGISADPRARRLAKMKEEGGDALLEASDDLE